MPDTMRIDQLADALIQHAFPNTGLDGARDPNYGGPCHAIDAGAVNRLSEVILDLIANTISTILDAGSERDAVNENESLLAEITSELEGWVAR